MSRLFTAGWRIGVTGEPYICRLVDWRGTQFFLGNGVPYRGFEVKLQNTDIYAYFGDNQCGGPAEALAAAILYRNKKIGVPANADHFKYRENSLRRNSLDDLDLPTQPVVIRRLRDDSERTIPFRLYHEKRRPSKAAPHAPRPVRHYVERIAARG